MSSQQSWELNPGVLRAPPQAVHPQHDWKGLLGPLLSSSWDTHPAVAKAHLLHPQALGGRKRRNALEATDAWCQGQCDHLTAWPASQPQASCALCRNQELLEAEAWPRPALYLPVPTPHRPCQLQGHSGPPSWGLVEEAWSQPPALRASSSHSPQAPAAGLTFRSEVLLLVSLNPCFFLSN